MFKKGIRKGICHAIHRYTRPNNKYMKDYDKYKESSYLNYCYGWAMSQKLPVNVLNGRRILLKLMNIS